MACIEREIKCCGGAELHGWDDPDQEMNLKDILTDLFDEYDWENETINWPKVDQGLSWLACSTVVSGPSFYGKKSPKTLGIDKIRKFQRDVHRLKLGRVVIHRGSNLNPNSLNYLRTAMFFPDCEAIRRYVLKKRWRQAYEQEWDIYEEEDY